MRYMHKALDESSKEKRDETYKVYHHLYDPAGTRYVTQRAGGIVSFTTGDSSSATPIAATKAARSKHLVVPGRRPPIARSVLAEEAGPVVGRHLLDVGWHGKGKKVFAREKREMSVYNLPGGTLVEFATRLASTVGRVKLDGDAQHAGFQFRAASEVAEKTKGKRITFVRLVAASRAKPKPESQEPRSHARVQEHALECHELRPRRQAIHGRLSRYAQQPQAAWYSERDYARFGSFFQYELDKGKDLTATTAFGFRTAKWPASKPPRWPPTSPIRSK